MDRKRIPLDRFSQWIYAVCVANFDVDIGQTLESIYPEHAVLTDSERNSVCYLAFPDSHSSNHEETQYHFRFKCTSISKLLCENFPLYYKSYVPSFLPVLDTCFGYVYFKQEKDTTQKRNYSQKSVVVLSPLPFDNFFYEVTKSITNAYFASGAPGIEQVCREIDQWPAPRSGEQLTLPLLGVTYNLRIPSAAGNPSDSLLQEESISNNQGGAKGDSAPSSSASSALSISSLAESIFESLEPTISMRPVSSESDNSADSYDLVPKKSSLTRLQLAEEIGLDSRQYVQAFAPVLSHLQRLWELVITAQPILVMASNPTEASQTVQALVSCISPFAFAADYRPFFTIYDTEFKDVARGSTSSPIAILGVTNPFFSKALHHWPNVIRLGRVKNMEKKKAHQLTPSKMLLLEDLRPGLYSRHKPFLKRDAGFFKRLKKALTDGTPTQCISHSIQRFFQELTMSFLIPLEHYLSSLMPLHRDISPFRCAPELNRFNMNEFFRTLETAGPRLTCDVKGDWVGLYKQFFSGPHFIHWLSQRESEIRQKLHALHLNAIMDTNFNEWATRRSEVEIVDMIIHLNQIATRNGEDREPRVDGLRRQIGVLLRGLPEDLRSVVVRSSSGTGAAVSVTSRG